jgi:hypothetical protein
MFCFHCLFALLRPYFALAVQMYSSAVASLGAVLSRPLPMRRTHVFAPKEPVFCRGVGCSMYHCDPTETTCVYVQENGLGTRIVDPYQPRDLQEAILDKFGKGTFCKSAKLCDCCGNFYCDWCAARYLAATYIPNHHKYCRKCGNVYRFCFSCKTCMICKKKQ